MREIKFKFWLGHTKQMTYEHTLIEISNAHWDFTEDIIRLQFTGLQDKNGKDIYEGDIIKRNDGVIKYVFYNERQGGYYTQFQNGAGFIDPIKYSIDRDCEIIGNIYENPELFTPQK